MSPRPVDKLLMRRNRKPTDAGFGLVEVIVSMFIFAVVATAVLPVFISGLQGAVSAKMQTQAKSLAQLRLERMHNMPFYVAQPNGPFRDLLDVYFRAAPLAGSSTTVPLDALDECKGGRRYEPARLTYTCDLGVLPELGGRFHQVVEAQFLNHLNQVVTPREGYDSQNSEMDTPASNLLGVAVTTMWKQGQQDKSYTLRGRIASTSDQVALINSEVRATALRISSALPGGDLLQFEAAVFNADGATSIASTASTTALGAHASLQSGASKTGASLNLNAPPYAKATTPLSGTGDSLDALLCKRLCWSDTALSGTAIVSVSDGLPLVSDAGAPLEARLLHKVPDEDPSTEDDRGFAYSNSLFEELDAALGILELPLVSGAQKGNGTAARSQGYLSATDTGTHEVISHGDTSLHEVRLLRTSEAPDGLVKIKLDAASIDCRGSASGGTVLANWSGTVSVADGLGSYVSYPVGPGAAPLPALKDVYVGSRQLSTWVKQWSSLVDSSSVTQRAGVGSIPAVITILTVPVRAGDESSAINIAVGSLACAAEDFR